MTMGFRFCRSQGMEGSTGNLREFPINPANANPIFTGDLVALSAGFVIEASGGANNNDFAVLGVFQGCRFVDAEGSYKFRNYWDGTLGKTECFAQVSVPSGCTFLVKGTAGGAYTAADIGVRKGVVYAAGNPATGYSNVRLGAPGANVATGPLMVIGEVEDVDESEDRWFEVAVVRNQLFPAVL